MFSGPPGNLFSIFMNVVFTSSFLHLCYIMCIFLYGVYEKSGKINKTQKTPKKPNKTQKKTQPLPYKRSDWDRVFLGYTPPPPPSQIFKYFGECSQFHKIINKARKVARHLVLHSFKYSCRDVTSFLFSNSLMILEISSLLQEHATTYSITQIISKTSIGIHLLTNRL